MGITCVCWGLTYNSFISGAKEIDIAATVEHLRDQRPSMVKTKVRDITFFCEIWMSGVGFYHCSVVALPYQLSIIICPNGLLIASSKASSFLFSWTLICNRPGVNRSVQIFCSPWFWDLFMLNLVLHPREKKSLPNHEKGQHTKFFVGYSKCVTQGEVYSSTPKNRDQNAS